jgi:preprotein translocase subunit SecA
MDDFATLYNDQNERKTDVYKLFDILIRYVAMDYGYCFWHDYIVNDIFEEDDFEKVQQLAEVAATKPRYIPCKQDFLKYSDWDYMEETPQLRKLREYIRRILPGNADLAEDILKNIYAFGNYKVEPKTYITLFQEHDIVLKPNQIRELFGFILRLRENLRLWMNNGHTTNERPSDKGSQLGSIKTPKVGRNEPCPCGSGKKYKKCCGY